MTSLGISNDLDPVFVKALGYLWSKSPDSTAKLNRMLTDAIEQSQKRKLDVKSSHEKAILKPTKHNPKLGKALPDSKRKEKDLSQKRQFEKLQKDLEELDQDVAKKSRYDNYPPGSSFLTPEHKMSPKNSISQESSSRNSPMTSGDDKDFSLEGLACEICNLVSNTQGNTPVECQECHNMYHRECHQPPISYQDANDPRCIWYCARCTKTMKKVAKQSSRSSTIPMNSLSKEKINSFDSKNKSAFVTTPFKREIKTNILSSNNGSGNSLSGWAALGMKNVATSATSTKNPGPKATTAPKPISSANLPSAHKRDKPNKPGKVGPKLAGSGAWAEALGAAPTGGKASLIKSTSKSSATWGQGSSGNKSIFPKAAASVPTSSGKASSSDVSAMKKVQMTKKKAKNNPKKSKI